MTELQPRDAASKDAPSDPVDLSIALVTRSTRLAREPAALDAMGALASALRTTSVSALGDDARLAFWLNVYNALDRHAIVAEDLRGHLVAKLGFFSRAVYVVDGQEVSLDVIEHGLLRGNRRAPMALFRTLRAGDARLQWAPASFEPRVHFALNCGARSCPAVRPYLAETVRASLVEATREYFAAECTIDRATHTVTLPFLARLYRGDFGDRDAMIAFAIEHLAPDEAQWLSTHRSSAKLRFGGYDWTITE